MVLEWIDKSSINYQFKVQRMRGFFDAIKISNYTYPLLLLYYAVKTKSISIAFK